MKVRNAGGEGEKIEPQMAPMIDVVFQLLIFFMLTLKIIQPEGNFNINMPLSQSTENPPDEPNLPELKVRLIANEDGSLARLQFGKRNLGNDARAFERLNNEILTIIGRPDDSRSDDVAVEIDADYGLHFGHTISAVGACTGRVDPKSKKIVRYIKNIKLTPPRPPQGT